MIDNSEIGGIIQELRIDSNQSQEAVAQRMKLEGYKWSQATVWSTEAGTRPLRLNEAVDLCWILNTSLDELLGGEKPLAPTGDHLLEEAVAAIEEFKRQNRMTTP